MLFAEQAGVLYVLATLATCGLLIVVAISNLEAGDVEMQTAAIKPDDMSTDATDVSRENRRAA